MQIANSCSWWTFRFHVGVHRKAIEQEKVYTQKQLEVIQINFTILNSFIIVIHLRFIKNIYFYAVKQKNWK